MSFALANMQSRLIAVLFIFLFLLTGSLMAQWTPPAVSKFTEAQLKTYLDTQKDWLDESAKLLQDSSTAKLDQNKGDDGGEMSPTDIRLASIGIISARWSSNGSVRRAADAWSAAAYLDGGVPEGEGSPGRRIGAIGRHDRRGCGSNWRFIRKRKSNGWRILKRGRPRGRDQVRAGRSEVGAGGCQAILG